VTLKLVAVEGETVPDATLSDELQDFADTIEPDAVGVISVVVQADASLRIVWHGQDYSSYELMGVFEAAKFRVIADDLADD
jgi:hypothetical protein